MGRKEKDSNSEVMKYQYKGDTTYRNLEAGQTVIFVYSNAELTKVANLYSENGKILYVPKTSTSTVDLTNINGILDTTSENNGIIPKSAKNYKYGYDRNITITVKDGNVDLGNLGMLVCNFNKDGYVNASDYATYLAASNTKLGAAKYNASCDFNHDGYINATDYAVYYAFSNARLSNAIYG